MGGAGRGRNNPLLVPGWFSISTQNYQLVYPDGSKSRVDRATRDDLVLSGLARQVTPGRYVFTGQLLTAHSLSELGSLNLVVRRPDLRRFLAGRFVFEHEGKRTRELLETPEALALRICEVAQ